MNRIICWFVKITGFLPQLLCFRTKIHYRNKSAQSRKIEGAAIIVSNHTSVFDYAVLMYVFPMRNIRCLMAEVLFKKNKLFAWFLRMLGGIKIDRDVYNFSFVSESCSVLEKGGVVEVFPEARLPLAGESRPLPFKPSAAYIAMLSGAPVIPVYTNGSYFNKKRAHVMIGEKIYPSDIISPKLSERENIGRITEYLRNAVMELGNELEKEIKCR